MLPPASPAKYQRQIWPCLVLLLLTLAIRLPLLGIPFERDEGEYAYIGWRLEHHELPYRDWIDQKPPAIFWIYRFAFLLPLNPVNAVHFMALLFAVAAACALFFLALRFMETWQVWMAGILFVLLSADPLLYGTEANTEMFMLLPLVLSVLAFFSSAGAVGQRRRIVFAVLVGIFIGIATAFKQVAAVQWPFLILMYPLFAAGKKSFAGIFFFAAASAVGIAAIWSAIVLYFALHHGLNDFIYNVFTHNLAYVQGVSWSRRAGYLINTLKSLSRDELPIWISSVVGLAWLLRSRRVREFIFFVLWLVASFAGASASGYFFPHYFQQILPALCLAAPLGVDALIRIGSLKLIPVSLQRGGLASLLVVLVVVVFWPFLFSYSHGQAVNAIYLGNDFADMQVLGARLAQVTRPDDKVFVFGADAEILFYAQRVSATRYIFLFPLYGPYPDAEAKQTAAANEIAAHAPAAVVFLPDQLFFAPGSEQFFTQWSEHYITENFRIDSCLAIDPQGDVIIVTDVPHQTSAVLDGLKLCGTLDVRKGGGPPAK